MKVITGWISFLFSTALILILTYGVISGGLRPWDDSLEDILIFTSLMISSIFVLYYCYGTEFWKPSNKDLDQLNELNERLKKSIELEELKKKLKSF